MIWLSKLTLKQSLFLAVYVIHLPLTLHVLLAVSNIVLCGHFTAKASPFEHT